MFIQIEGEQFSWRDQCPTCTSFYSDYHPKYKQFEYFYGELTDILAATDLVITRGGSNAIFEFLALNTPMLIIPLGLN